MKKDSLGDRMKQFEDVTRYQLMPRMPVIIRVDGKAFHTFTKQFEFPFSVVLHKIMSETAENLFKNIQNARLVYFQSDEISILLNDWGTHETQQWFGGGLQKMVSVSASYATSAFAKSYLGAIFAGDVDGEHFDSFPQFDSRVFTLPREEVCNYFIWRQQDASRNSVRMLGSSMFSHRQLHGKNNSQVQDMLMQEHGINWNDIDTWKRRGACVTENGLDEEIPLFTSDRDYVNRHLMENPE